jgi:PAS domain-containing protein
MRMDLSNGLVYLLFAAISLLSAAAAMVVTGQVQRFGARSRAHTPAQGPDAAPPASSDMLEMPRSYEFRDGYLVSALPEDDAFLGPGTDPARAFSALSESLSALHPDLSDRMTALSRRGEGFVAIGHLGPDAISVSGRTAGNRIVVTVMAVDEAGGRRAVDARSLEAMEEEAADLRRALALTGAVQWKETPDGRVTWANPAYLDLAERCRDGDKGRLGWPLPRIFGDQLDPPPPEGTVRRCRIAVPDREEALWFEAAATRLSGEAVLCSARAVDRLVAAESSLRDFVQTLTRTFAALPIGLAVFDRSRELVLFNPALVEISTLEPAFLSSRPTLRSFLDHLRERRRMPEPRDYRGWREEIAHLERGAEAGNYHQLWTLPGGGSLRVTGRPHADGAIAFMFEDISKEMSLTRRFRGEIDLRQAVADDMAAAFAVFSRDGRRLQGNAAYAAMWEHDAEPLGTEALARALHRWRAAFAPSGIWGEIRDFAAHAVDRAAWSETLVRTDGARVLCRVAPLKGGHTVVWFVPEGAAAADPLAGWLASDGPTRAEIAARDVEDTGQGARQGAGVA